MSKITNNLDKFSDDVKRLAMELSDAEKEGFTYSLQSQRPMFRDKEETRKYEEYVNENPAMAKVVIVYKQFMDRVNNLRLM